MSQWSIMLHYRGNKTHKINYWQRLYCTNDVTKILHTQKYAIVLWWLRIQESAMKEYVLSVWVGLTQLFWTFFGFISHFFGFKLNIFCVYSFIFDIFQFDI